MAQRRRGARRPTKAEREFVSEAEDILERLRESLADLDDQRVSRQEVDPELVNVMFRAAHSLKSLAGMFGFDPLRDLAHRLEDVLDRLRLGRVALDSDAPELIDEAVRLFATLLGHVGEPDTIAAHGSAIADLTGRIEALNGDSGGRVSAAQGLDLDESLLRALTEYEEHRLCENLSRGRHILLVDATFELLAFEEGLSSLSSAVREVAELISTLPAPGDSPDSQIRFSLLAASERSAAELASLSGLEQATIRELSRPQAAGAAERATAPEPESPPSRPSSADAKPEEAEPPAASAELDSLRSISDTVRVDIRKLDELMNLVGELVIQRGAIGDLVERLTAHAATLRAGQELAKVHKAMDRKLRELQAAVLDVRMVPLRQVFEKVSRVVRNLRRDLDKDVRLEIRGADTELDKLIVESLVDPLMHVVRNALDHAIEPGAERRAAGKPEQGCIRVEALQRGNHVVIQVSDDGRGLDRQALRERAERLGIVERDEVLTEREELDLVFAPGVSTRAEVTETSGRGVGMDVVRSNLTGLGGVVGVESAAGRGTTVSLTLPITLAIIQSLIVRAGGQRFAIPLTAVLETLMLDAGDIQRSEARSLLNLRGEALPLSDLGAALGLAGRCDRAEKPYAVVVGMGEMRCGLLVDALEGQQDTVIKSIQGPIASVPAIAGATELGDEEPVLVLDVSALVEDARRREAA